MRILKKIGYRNQSNCNELINIYYRPNTTDEKVITEVLENHCYQKQKIGFLIEPTDVWLDLGANIGTFAILVSNLGGKVICVEPENENIALLQKNLRTNNFNCHVIESCVVADNNDSKHINLYLCQGSYNKYRHSIIPKKGRQSVRVACVKISDLLKMFPTVNCIKMDIEGAEIDILENIDLDNLRQIQKLVFEYSFDIDPSIPRFLKIIERLKNVYNTVYYTKVKSDELEYKYFPPCVNVYCS